MQPKIEVIKLFCRDYSRELTIRQISKLIKKSYAYTNKEVRQLISEGVLNRKIIGASILCSLNYASERALGLLVMNSIIEREGLPGELINKINDLLNQIIEYIDSAFVVGENVLSSDKSFRSHIVSAIGQPKKFERSPQRHNENALNSGDATARAETRSELNTYVGEKLGIICRNEFEVTQKIQTLSPKLEIMLFDKSSFKKWVKKESLANVQVIYGYEQFWRLLKDE